MALKGVAAAVAIVVAVTGGVLWYRSRHVQVPLLSETVAMAPADQRSLVPDGQEARLLKGSRIESGARDSQGLLESEREWLASSTLPPGLSGPESDLARSALLDIHSLVLRDGAAVAGWSPIWRYVWPRDASFVAAALAGTGHITDATRILLFLQRVQPSDGRFQARYLPDGSGRVPDTRGIQLDGVGWTLWGLKQWNDALPEYHRGRRGKALREFIPLLDRSSRAAIRALDNPSGLPAPSPDFWETKENQVTLGTVAPLLAGLQSCQALYATLSEQPQSQECASAAGRLATRIHAAFGPDYPRELSGGGSDASVTMLLAPFTNLHDPAITTALHTVMTKSRRPAGGYAPGADWKHDGISWTPETALYALSAASNNDPALATSLLTWLGDHRTKAGSFPEKVLSGGQPAAVAPLSWTAALVLLTLHALHPAHDSG